MRYDLAKLTTERERSGSSQPSRKYGGRIPAHTDPDHDYPNEHGGIHSASRYRNGNSKELSDVLTPLRGTLRKNLNRPWDKIYSEFCQILDRRSVSGYHIWTHLQRMVATDTLILNGKILEFSPYSGYRPVIGFYVHPVTGLLRYQQPPKRPKRPPVQEEP